MPLKAVTAALVWHLAGYRLLKTGRYSAQLQSSNMHYKTTTNIYSRTMVCLAIAIFIGFGRVFRKYRLPRRFTWPFRDLAWVLFTIMFLEFGLFSFWLPFERNIMEKIPKFASNVDRLCDAGDDELICSIIQLVLRPFQYAWALDLICVICSTTFFLSSLHACKLVNWILIRNGPRVFLSDAFRSTCRALCNKFRWNTRTDAHIRRATLQRNNVGSINRRANPESDGEASRSRQRAPEDLASSSEELVIAGGGVSGESESSDSTIEGRSTIHKIQGPASETRSRVARRMKPQSGLGMSSIEDEIPLSRGTLGHKRTSSCQRSLRQQRTSNCQRIPRNQR